jgi:hypothetical protein
VRSASGERVKHRHTGSESGSACRRGSRRPGAVTELQAEPEGAPGRGQVTRPAAQVLLRVAGAGPDPRDHEDLDPGALAVADLLAAQPGGQLADQAARQPAGGRPSRTTNRPRSGAISARNSSSTASETGSRMPDEPDDNGVTIVANGAERKQISRSSHTLSPRAWPVSPRRSSRDISRSPLGHSAARHLNALSLNRPFS